jgi:hypothetical protein
MSDSRSFQQLGPQLRVRRLKIEAEGDFWKGLTKPKIRLIGRWLERAGFKPGHHVHVAYMAPGVIELRSTHCLPPSETTAPSSEPSGSAS